MTDSKFYLFSAGVQMSSLTDAIYTTKLPSNCNWMLNAALYLVVLFKIFLYIDLRWR
jgi:hypothetical protein